MPTNLKRGSYSVNSSFLCSLSSPTLPSPPLLLFLWQAGIFGVRREKPYNLEWSPFSIAEIATDQDPLSPFAVGMETSQCGRPNFSHSWCLAANNSCTLGPCNNQLRCPWKLGKDRTGISHYENTSHVPHNIAAVSPFQEIYLLFWKLLRICCLLFEASPVSFQ